MPPPGDKPDQKAPEKVEVPQTAETAEKTESPEANAQSQEALNRLHSNFEAKKKTAEESREARQEIRPDLDKIKTQKEEIDKEQKQLAETAAAKRDKENWVKNPSSSPLIDPRPNISEGIEKKTPNIKAKLEAMGLHDDTNLNIIKQALKDVIYDHYTKTGKEGSVTETYANGELDDKVSYLFDELKKTLDEKKDQSDGPRLLENFSEFTGTGFFKKGFLQAGEAKELLLLDRSCYATFIENFKKSLEKGEEKKQLEGSEIAIKGETTDPKELLKQYKLSKIPVTAPADAAKLDDTLQAEIPKALPPIDNPKVKEKIVKYLADELKKLNPQPGEIFELSAEGQWSKIDTAAEKQSTEEARKDAETKAAAIAAQAETSPAGFSFGETFKSIGDAIMQLLKWIASLVGIKFGTDAVADLMKEWKDVTPDEQARLKNFYGTGKKFFEQMKNIDKLVKDPVQMRLVLAKKQTDGKPNENWDDWIGRHLTAKERDEINTSDTITTQRTAELLMSENIKTDVSAQPIAQPGSSPKPPAAPAQAPAPAGGTPAPAESGAPATAAAEGPKPAVQDKSIERVNTALSQMEAAPYSNGLKAIMEYYIKNKGTDDMKQTIEKANSTGRTIEVWNYLNLISKFIEPDLNEKIQKGQTNAFNSTEGIFDNIFTYALNTAPPELKQEAAEVEKQLKATLDQPKAENAAPAATQSPPAQPSGNQPQPTGRS